MRLYEFTGAVRSFQDGIKILKCRFNFLFDKSGGASFKQGDEGRNVQL